ncbi:lamin tail domain-containing protein [Brumimicrobium oceani]|uniref:LTD domain-containing protein n=1 Tax=Brumimicrobium oceani TaxID=2100725 RepID=A0A2U2X0G5_9FLAO|nr:lamin tail domain-containing protein [Brumimicrobium oceani]PWH81244.1 hypothetical protein DIT68_15730 [Brumimicrobium oceani]
MKKLYLFMLTALMITFSSELIAQDIVITEIMYNPPESGTDSLEFIELYNNGITNVDLTGWSFSQGVSHTFGAVTMNPGEYVVVAVDAGAIQNVFGYSTAIEWTSGGLSNGGENIVLVDAGGITVDQVDYDDSGVWPSGFSSGNPDGGGASLVLCDPNSDNDDGSNWFASTTNSGVTINGNVALASPGAADNVCLTLCNSVSSFTAVACASYTVPSGDEVYTTSGIYLDTIPNAAGCDSVMTIDLTINNATIGTDVQVACGSFTWIDGMTYTASNNAATSTIVGGAANGCDSIVTLDLTINPVATGTDVQTACGSFTWIDGVTYTASNSTATSTIVGGAANGCDSIVTLDLTINPVATGTDVQTACGSFTWIDGVIYTASNNTATSTIVGGAANGCDSIVTLDLTINNATTGTDVQVACGSYTWIDGVTYTASNNTATSTIVGGAANGCDSIVTLDLTINSAVTGTDVQVACGSYTWIDGVTYTASNNTATSTIVGGAANGCDSIVTLDLTINSAVTGTDIQTACGSFTWIDGMTYTASNSTATSTIVGGAANGCDSIVTLDLTIESPNDAGTGDTVTVCMNEPIDFDTLSSLGTVGTWLDFTNTSVSGVNSIALAGTYEYRYIVSTSLNCDPDTAFYSVVVDGGCDYLSVDQEMMSDISVYPNPATSVLSILNPSNTSSLKVEILDMNGRVVLVENNLLNNTSKATISIDYLQKGIYTLRVYNEKAQKTFKIVKQ